GRVTDALTGRAVDGVQVFIAGTELGTLTNADGRYQFSVRAGPLELHTRRVGYASLTRRVTVTPGEATDADFELRQAALALDAVVVTGTGAETEKRKLGNTVTTIDASTLRNAPVTNLSEQLAARDPSVSVLPSGGLTGEGAQIRIRATASLTQANEPVVYVDGVRVHRGGGFGDTNWLGADGGRAQRVLRPVGPALRHPRAAFRRPPVRDRLWRNVLVIRYRRDSGGQVLCLRTLIPGERPVRRPGPRAGGRFRPQSPGVRVA